MRHGSLFSGIGGFDLAAEWMGWENVFHCEWNPFGQKILHYYWPNAEQFTDITKSNFTKYANKIDILTGGFPCQPYSMAGKRRGKDDERHLWPEMLRAIREIQPRWVVGENVRGLTNWNGGMVFDEVCADLENLGYQVAPYIIPASSIGAPHQRERIWFVAYRNVRSGQEYELCTGRDLSKSGHDSNGNTANANGDGFNQCNGDNEIDPSQGGKYAQRDIESGNGDGNAADTDPTRRGQSNEKMEGRSSEQSDSSCIQQIDTNANAIRLQGSAQLGSIGEKGEESRNKQPSGSFCSQWEIFPAQSPVCGGDDGLPTHLDGITFPKWRAESIKGYGNAIVPQVVYQIFKTIEEYDRTANTAQDH